MYSIRIQKLKDKYNQLRGKHDEIFARIAENEVECRILKKKRERIQVCNKLLRFISENNQNKIVKLFEHTISSGLKDLFDSSYEFGFEQKTRGDSSACEFVVKTRILPKRTSIKMCHGDSIAQLVGAIFRIILTKLDKRSRKIVVLDEAFGGIEVERQSITSKFLASICEKFKIQLIVVTHNEEFCESVEQIINIDKELRHGKK